MIYHNAASGLPMALDDPNGTRALFEYDALGRQTRIQLSDSTPIVISYRNLIPGIASGRPKSWRIHLAVCAVSDLFGHQCNVYDPAGQVLTRSAEGFNMEVRTTYVYDQLGGLLKQSLPFDASQGPPRAFTILERDGLERVTKIQRPGDTVLSPPVVSAMQYDGLRTNATSERGVITISDVDEKGRLVRRSTEDPGTNRLVTTAYQYWHFDLPRNIFHPVLPPSQAMNPNPPALITSMTYDSLGRLESLTDADAGVTRKRYNAFGELKRLQNANGGVTSYSYDNLGRISLILTPATGDYPSQSANAWAQRTQITYDTSPNGIGRPASITSNDNIQNSFEYDSSGRIRASDWTVPGLPDALRFVFEFGVDGRLEYVNYPQIPDASGLRLKYVFNGGGRIQEVDNVSDPNNPSLIWQQLTRSAAGKSTGEQFGLTETVLRTYDATNELKTVLGTFNPSGIAFQELSYSWGPDGMVQSRADVANAAAAQESFSHDFLGRLVHWNVEQAQNITHWRYDYDDLGNLRSRATVLPAHPPLPPASVQMFPSTEFAYTTPADVEHPHAVKTISTDHRTVALTYDMAGQMRTDADHTYTWTPFGLPWKITNSLGTSETFLYDGKGARIVENLRSDQQTMLRHTVTLGGLFEIHTSSSSQEPAEVVYNVPATEGIVAQVRRDLKSGADSIHFIHPDVLGSSDAITTQSVDPSGQSVGTLVERGKYEPFGERRSDLFIAEPSRAPNDWDATLGFTGQEPDIASGIINMRGRLYSTNTARFISPDPRSQFGSSEGLNRYSYVHNSPLVFTDPTGYQEFVLSAAPPTPSDPPLLEAVPLQSDPNEWLPYPPSVPHEHVALPSDPIDISWLQPPTPEGPQLWMTTAQNELDMSQSKMNNFDLPPLDYLMAGRGDQNIGPKTFGYAIAYGLKHSFYEPIREWLAPSTFYAVDSNGHVRDYSELHNSVASHADAIPALINIALLFIKGPPQGPILSCGIRTRWARRFGCPIRI